MPELNWNEYEFVECLGVLPEVDGYETRHHFRVEQDSLTLLLSVWQYDSLFEISLYQSGNENPFISFHLAVREQVKFVNDKRGSYLSFQDCLVVSSNYKFQQIANFVRHIDVGNLNMELEVKPQIKIKFI